MVGSRFELALVERVVGRDLVDAFDESAKAGIVIEEPGGRYRFNHAIVRQSLLAELASRPAHAPPPTHSNDFGVRTGRRGTNFLPNLPTTTSNARGAGNAAKAVDYCKRAADQAMARLAYEGAADLYNKAVHALEDLDDESSTATNREAGNCWSLAARHYWPQAMSSQRKASVSQLQSSTAHSGRLAAWGACFDGQLSMLTDPERLDEIDAAVTAAATSLAQVRGCRG